MEKDDVWGNSRNQYEYMEGVSLEELHHRSYLRIFKNHVKMIFL